jgi:hypothetical protein
MLLMVLVLAEPPMAPPPSTRAELVFKLAEQQYDLAIPIGYCVPKIAPPGPLGEITNARGTTISKVVYLQLCERIGEPDADQDFLIFKYWKNGTVEAQSRAEFVQNNAPAIQSDEFIAWLESDELTARAEKRAEQEFGNEFAVNARAQPLGHDDSCIYNGARISAAVPNMGTGETMKSVTCTTFVDQRLVIIDIVGNEKRGESFPSLARKLRDMVRSIKSR